MRAEQFRAHAAYCQQRLQAAPDAASRRRWESECADWLNLELSAVQTDVARVGAAFAQAPALTAPLREARSFL